ncbi:hypothetical protein [Halomonas alkalisoli]|uniref:hypothetical protein n=1 Tax=Halomonas alkalisoli TaxID=2907158 RepID=UPI001F2CB386|nr:hypothetical protein [Halomonas alkalisoli]MCE9681961.1 hypothetical protein [Halomonas alkalisoli]
MAKPRIKLKTVARHPAARAAISEEKAERVLSLFGTALGMSVDEIKRDPLAARARLLALEAEHRQAKENIAAAWAPALNMTTEQIAAMPPDEIRRRIAEHGAAAAVNKFRGNVMEAIQACRTTGQMRFVNKAVDRLAAGMPMDRVADYIFDLAAAESDGHSINNAHSPEGGHRAGIDYQKIYDRQNRKEGGVA